MTDKARCVIPLSAKLRELRLRHAQNIMINCLIPQQHSGDACATAQVIPNFCVNVISLRMARTLPLLSKRIRVRNKSRSPIFCEFTGIEPNKASSKTETAN